MLDLQVKRGKSAVAGSQGDASGSGGIQWTLKNVDRQAVELSRQAARKRGMKFGKWVTEVLREAATAEMNGRNRDDGNDIIVAKLSEFETNLGDRIEKIQRQSLEIQHDLRVLQLLVPEVAKSAVASK